MPLRDKSRLGFLVTVGLVLAVSLVTYPIYQSLDFVVGAMLMLLIVLYVSISYGMGPAILASVLASIYLNYYFVEPVLEVNIGSGHDLIALPAFIITAVVVGRLSQRAAIRATEAERGRQEIERLYGELQLAFEKSSNLEAVKRSEQMKSALLDAVTHDLRTPLTSIKAAATTLYRGIYATAQNAPLAPELREELIEVVIQETDRLNHFIDELLVLAKIQGGSVDVTEPPGTAEEALMAATQRADSVLKGFQLAITIVDSAGERQIANPRIAAQALYSLLENAAKYSPRGSKIAITVEANDQRAKFAVQDEGPGIPREEREMIFSRFYRRKHPSTAASPGLGMGLAIARGLVEAVGGTIAVAEKDGIGTCFEFSVPVFKTPAKQEGTAHDSSAN